MSNTDTLNGDQNQYEKIPSPVHHNTSREYNPPAAGTNKLN